MNKIVNMKYGFVVYGEGRFMKVDRSTVLGNPFLLKGGKKGSTLRKYRKWLWKKICERDERVIEMLMRIDEDTVLGCWCDEKCHAEVVSRAAKWLRENGGLRNV